MNLSSGLAGLSAAYPAYVKGRTSENLADQSDIQTQDMKRASLAKVAMGNALALLGGPSPGQGNVVPGQPGMPQGQGPQPPAPGQPSQPMMPPGGAPPMAGGPPGMPPQGGPPGMPPRPPGPMPGQPPMMAPSGPAPGGGGPPGAAPQGAPGGLPPGMGGMQPPGGGQPGQRQGAMDWRQLVAAVKQANPNLPPDVMAEAVNQFLPLMNAQSQQEWRNISLQMREQSLQQRMEQFQLAERGRNERADTAETGRDTRSERSDTRMRDRATQQQQQFDTREKRLGESLKLREDSTWARLEQQKEQARQRVDASQGKQGLAELRAAIDAQDKHVRTRIQAYSAQNTMKPAERDKMLKEADTDYEQQIKALKERYGRGSTGVQPVGTGGPKNTERAPQGDPASVVKPQLPPEAVGQLKEGHVTTFQNGQKWTIKNGQPEQVP